MGRASTNTADYFLHKAKHGKTLFILQGQFGNDGYAVMWKVYELLTVSDNHYYDCRSDQDWEYFVSYMKVTSDRCAEIMKLLVTLGVVDRELWEKKIVWCQPIVDYFTEKVYKKRGRPAPSKPFQSGTEIKLDDRFLRHSGTETPLFAPEIPQSREENSTVKEREYPDGFSATFSIWNEQQVIKHDEPNQAMIRAFEKARKTYPLETIQGAIKRYGTVIRGGKDYWFSYRWRFELFLSRKNAIPQFTDDTCLQTMKKTKGGDNRAGLKPAAGKYDGLGTKVRV